MRRGFWLAALLLGPTGAFAQQAATSESAVQHDLPDNTSAFTRDTSGVSKTPPPERAAPPDGARQAQAAVPRAAPSSERELLGVVVKAEPHWLWLDYMGTVVPFVVTQQTRFEGTPGARLDALDPGQEVRARYHIVAGHNVVSEVQLAPASVAPSTSGLGRGGSGRSTGASRDPIDTDLHNPSLVPSTGEVKGPANPIP